jgi:hypothetical protein
MVRGSPARMIGGRDEYNRKQAEWQSERRKEFGQVK